MGDLNDKLISLKKDLDDIYKLMLSNARNHRPVHPIVYAKYLQDTIDSFSDVPEMAEFLSALKAMIARIRSHIEYNAHNMESMYCCELSRVIGRVTGSIDGTLAQSKNIKS